MISHDCDWSTVREGTYRFSRSPILSRFLIPFYPSHTGLNGECALRSPKHCVQVHGSTETIRLSRMSRCVPWQPEGDQCILVRSSSHSKVASIYILALIFAQTLSLNIAVGSKQLPNKPFNSHKDFTFMSQLGYLSPTDRPTFSMITAPLPFGTPNPDPRRRRPSQRPRLRFPRKSSSSPTVSRKDLLIGKKEHQEIATSNLGCNGRIEGPWRVMPASRLSLY